MTKNPPFPPNLPYHVEILAFTGAQLLDICGPLQVFVSTNDRAVEQKLAQCYELHLVAPAGTKVATAGVELLASPLPAIDSPIDTLVIAGGRGISAALTDAVLIEWIRGRAKHARRVTSVCSGAFLLGAAGLLDGRRATTHWARCAELSARFPEVQVEADPIFVRDGSIWTSAGVTAGMDLALALVEDDLGKSMALTVARHLVMFLKRPGGQAQFSVPLALQGADDRFAALHDWLTNHLAEHHTLPKLAVRAGMTERTFSRRYFEATGLTPARAIERLRAEEARRLLTDTNLAIKRIARSCGYNSEETMRRSFLRLLSTTPQAYRSRFKT
jgi:transcriptional regulator GlxA family with amidase domain